MFGFKKKQDSVRRPQLMAGQNDYVFRRSRTLTGTRAEDIAVPAAPRGQLKTDRIKLHELTTRRRHVLRMLGGVVAIAVCLAFLVGNFIATPALVFPQTGVHTPEVAKYREAIYGYFGERPLERFGFLLRPSDLEQYLKQKHTELVNITLERNWYGGNATFGVFFRQPLLAWSVAGKQMYVDGQGVAFTYNHFVEPQVAVTDQSGLPPDQFGMVASTRFIRFLGRMVGAVNDYKKGKVIAVTIPPSTRQIDLKLEGRDYPLKTNSDRDPAQQAEDIANALNYLDKQGIKPQYVDLRVAHKAFYK